VHWIAGEAIIALFYLTLRVST